MNMKNNLNYKIFLYLFIKIKKIYDISKNIEEMIKNIQ